MTTPTVDLEQWKRQRDHVQELAQKMSTGVGSVDATVYQLVKLSDMQNGIIDALINDLAYLNEVSQMNQGQMGNIAQQSFIAIEMLKRKNLATADEISAVFKEVMERQMAELERRKREQESKIETPVTPAVESGKVIQFPGSTAD